MFRLKDFRKQHGLNQDDVAALLGCTQPNISSIEKEGKDLTEEQLDILKNKYGEQEVLKYVSGVKFYDPEDAPRNRRLIPIYSDAVTEGGSGDLIPGSTGGGVDEWIDSGDWFKNITGAIRHYGESMIEYPSGCILALKEVQDRRLIVPGRNYVIETSEYRVTKKVQFNDSGKMRVRSTNEEKYEDGTLIYNPFDIEWELVWRIFEVLGYVVKQGSGTMVYTSQK